MARWYVDVHISNDTRKSLFEINQSPKLDKKEREQEKMKNKSFIPIIFILGFQLYK